MEPENVPFHVSEIGVTITLFPEMPNESSKFYTDLKLTPSLISQVLKTS
jgi:hypothetical protein